MGGTTAKLCLIDDAEPLTSRTFEVGRVYRFMKGSGLPMRIPVIEMVEIGSGGGSIATVDNLGRINVGPESAGARPGPACYGHGGTEATVTDAELLLGRIDENDFAGGTMTLSRDAADSAIETALSKPLGLDGHMAAFAVAEMVCENMAAAARVHAAERGVGLAGRTMIAFGGGAPLHAGRMAEKLGVDTVIVPFGAGVGSAIGFLKAPVAYEVVRSRYLALDAFDGDAANTVIDAMRAEALAIVEPAAGGGQLAERRSAYMRYLGQGHEITVDLPVRPLVDDDGELLQKSFDAAYVQLYGRTIPGLAIEILSWTLTMGTTVGLPNATADPAPEETPKPAGTRKLFDFDQRIYKDCPVYRRHDLKPGTILEGPCVIIEGQTTSVIPATFDAMVNSARHLILQRRPEGAS
jgi:N-methylhydantoinase A